MRYIIALLIFTIAGSLVGRCLAQSVTQLSDASGDKYLITYANGDTETISYNQTVTNVKACYAEWQRYQNVINEINQNAEIPATTFTQAIQSAQATLTAQMPSLGGTATPAQRVNAN